MNRPGAISLVYILSSGRSGSTLLDVLLDCYDNAFSLGEAQFLPYVIAHKLPTGSGKEVEECPFWSGISHPFSLGQGNGAIDHFRDGKAGRLLRWNLLPSLFGKDPSQHARQLIQRYSAENRRYFALVQDRCNSFFGHEMDWLIDASKDPYRLLWLQRSGDFNIRVVHLTKDPRSFVYSMGRKDGKPVILKILRQSARWAIENTIMRSICERSFQRGTTLHIRYEDLATNPGETLSKIDNDLGLHLQGQFHAEYWKLPHFGLAGNKMRLRSDPIRLDRRWESGLGTIHKALVMIACGWRARSFGYTVRS